MVDEEIGHSYYIHPQLAPPDPLDDRCADFLVIHSASLHMYRMSPRPDLRSKLDQLIFKEVADTRAIVHVLEVEGTPTSHGNSTAAKSHSGYACERK